jgi:hypothetical protein
MHRINALARIQLESLAPNRIGNAVMALRAERQKI